MSQSEKNLKEAFAGESQANRKYLAFAEKAEKEGYAQIAKLFKAATPRLRQGGGGRLLGRSDRAGFGALRWLGGKVGDALGVDPFVDGSGAGGAGAAEHQAGE